MMRAGATPRSDQPDAPRASRSGFAAAFRKTASFNMATTLLSATSGLLIARWLNPTGRGQYAGVTTWVFFVLVFGEVGLSSAVVYFVSRDPSRARTLVRTATVYLTAVSIPLAGAALLLSPILSRGDLQLLHVYHVAFASIPVAFIGAAPSFALQSLSLPRWGLVRLSQPLIFVLLIVSLRINTALTLLSTVTAYVAATAAQTVLAWVLYWAARPAPGRLDLTLLPPLLRYGLPSFLAGGPALINGRVDQLVLALVVPAADLGRYAVAVALTTIAAPLTSAFGNVLFPRLAADAVLTEVGRAHIRSSLRANYAVSLAVALLVSIACYWLIAPVFGPAYSGVYTLVLILAPGAVLVASNQLIGDALRGLGKPLVAARAECLGAVLTVVGLGVLVPLTGVVGAALTSTFVYGIVHLLLRRLLSRCLAST
jgi:O-antigen/teichoic acid export membrane protein